MAENKETGGQHKYRVLTDVLEKVTKRDADGNAKRTRMHRKGDVVDYSDEPERAKELLAHRAIAKLSDEGDEEEGNNSAVNPAAAAAVNDTTNGGAAGGQAVRGPDTNSPVAVPGPKE